MLSCNQSNSKCGRRRPRVSVVNATCFSTFCLSILICAWLTEAFVPQSLDGPKSASSRSNTFIAGSNLALAPRLPLNKPASWPASSTALNVWWFGGTESSETIGDDDESCELVAVRIERTSANSRRIAGDITVSAPLEAVWGILTDYNRLAVHVPNLVESKIVSTLSRGKNGDGSFRCRLFQKGAQKIIGFEFGASVTMDMQEQILVDASSSRPQERRINFKCVDSQFFSGFDGTWTVSEQEGFDGEKETKVSYVVDVRPKGPVPVAALEWRIREDVPTNLRSVKASSLKAYEKANNSVALKTSNLVKQTMTAAANGVRNSTRQPQRQQLRPAMVPVMADWDRDETMAKYL